MTKRNVGPHKATPFNRELLLYFCDLSSQKQYKLSALFSTMLALTHVSEFVIISDGSDARRPFKRFVDLVVCRVRPIAGRSGCFKVDGRPPDAAPFLHLRVRAHKRQKVRLAAAHGVQPSQLNRLNGSNQSSLAIGSAAFGSSSGFAGCHQSSIRCLRSAPQMALES
jgi:hypothetical protein